MFRFDAQVGRIQQLSFSPNGQFLVINGAARNGMQVRSTSDYECTPNWEGKDYDWFLMHTPCGRFGLFCLAKGLALDESYLHVVGDCYTDEQDLAISAIKKLGLFEPDFDDFTFGAGDFLVFRRPPFTTKHYRFEPSDKGYRLSTTQLEELVANQQFSKAVLFGQPRRVAIYTQVTSPQSGQCEHYLHIYDGEIGERLRQHRASPAHFDRWTASPCGRSLAALQGDTFLFWDTAFIHQPPRRLKQNPAVKQGKQFTDLAYHPSGRYLATACNDKSITLWDVASRQIVKVFRFDDARTKAIAFAPDGLTAAAGTEEGHVIVFDTDLD